LISKLFVSEFFCFIISRACHQVTTPKDSLDSPKTKTNRKKIEENIKLFKLTGEKKVNRGTLKIYMKHR
jgi:hypothetical protein